MMVSGGKIPHRSGVRMLFPPSLQRGEPRFARNKGGVRMLFPPSLQRGEPRLARNKGGVRMLFPPRASAFAKMRFRFLHHVRSGLAETAGLCINGAPAMRVPLPNAYFSEFGPASGKFMLIFCSAGNPGFRRKIVAYTGGACARRRESKLTQCVPSPRQRNLTVHLSERARLRKS